MPGKCKRSIGVFEKLLDGCFKQARQAEGQRQARIEFPGLDRVHTLPRNFQPFRQIRLRPIPFSAKHPQTVFHRYLRRTSGSINPNATHQAKKIQYEANLPTGV